MENAITLRLLNSKSQDIHQAKELIINSFPTCERRDTDEWLKCIARENNEPFTIYGIYQNKEFAGFITLWDFPSFSYIEHFAVNPDARGNGIGAKSIQLIKNLYGETPLVLEAEPPCDDMSTRRIGFYQRQGFTLDSTPYLQPPYREEDNWFELKLMTTNIKFLTDNFDIVREYIYKNVYHAKLPQ